MRIITTLIFTFIFLSHTSSSQTLVSGTKINSLSQSDLVTMGVFNAKNGVDLYHIIYNTIGTDGNPTIASGALAVPIISDCDSFALVNYNHGTVLLKSDVPSRQSGEEFVGITVAAGGAIATMPDYLGLGDGPGLHPYQHAETEATATLDMIRASREYVQTTLGNFNGQVFLSGYSQGGHAAMATYKYIQENNLLNEFNVIACAPASGAYDMSETTADFIFGTTYSNPGYIVYLIEAYQLAYGNLYTTRDQYYKAPYDVQILPYLNGDSTMSSLNAILPGTISSFIEDSVLLNYQADTINFTHPLRAALRDNNVYDWAPLSLVDMSYCEADEQVPYQNSLVALNTMQANGATKVSATSRGAAANHGGCVLPSLIAVQSLFGDLIKPCVPTGIENYDLANNISLYPNPTNGFVTIDLPVDINTSFIHIKDITGKNLFEKKATTGKNNLDLSDYQKGVYLIQVSTKNTVITKKLIVQ